jgi:hypothetical protein
MSHDNHPRTRPGVTRPRTRPPRKTRPRTRVAPVLTAVVAVVAVIGLFLFGIAAESFGRNDTAAATTVTGQVNGPAPAKEHPAAADPSPGIGQPVRDGRFEFVVSRVDCSKSQVGLEYLHRTAKGRFCVVSLSITNIADEPQFFLGRAQQAFDAGGTKFTDDAVAGFFANRNATAFLDKIDPGERISGRLVFDVPKKTTLTAMELHDSFFSGGARVVL